MMKTPGFWHSPNSWLSRLLGPAALLYRAGRALDVAFSKPKTFAVPVWCVGNAVAGGAGKTPVTMALLALLGAAVENNAVHVVTRGYRGRLSGPVRADPAKHTADDVGDEPLLLAALAPTWVARRRADGIAAAIDAGAALVLLDDGLQNTGIRPAKNILVIDAATGFGNGRLLPAGPLREPLAAVAKRVDAVVLVGDGAPDVAAFASIPMFRARVKPDAQALDVSAKYLAFSGIARPQKFFATARAVGLQLAQTVSYPDHYRYTLKDWHHLLRQARECGAHLLTTTKDAARLSPTQRAQVRQLPIALLFEDESALRQLLQGWQNA